MILFCVLFVQWSIIPLDHVRLGNDQVINLNMMDSKISKFKVGVEVSVKVGRIRSSRRLRVPEGDRLVGFAIYG